MTSRNSFSSSTKRCNNSGARTSHYKTGTPQILTHSPPNANSYSSARLKDVTLWAILWPHTVHLEIALTQTYLEPAAYLLFKKLPVSINRGRNTVFCVVETEEIGLPSPQCKSTRTSRHGSAVVGGRVPYGAIGIDVTRRTSQRRGTPYILSSSFFPLLLSVA